MTEREPCGREDASRQGVIGAGAVITEGKQFEPRSLVVGAPARVVRTLTPEQVAALTAGAPVYIAKGRRYKTGLKRIG